MNILPNFLQGELKISMTVTNHALSISRHSAKSSSGKYLSRLSCSPMSLKLEIQQVASGEPCRANIKLTHHEAIGLLDNRVHHFRRHSHWRHYKCGLVEDIAGLPLCSTASFGVDNTPVLAVQEGGWVTHSQKKKNEIKQAKVPNTCKKWQTYV